MLQKISEKVHAGKRLTKRDALALYKSDDIFTLGELATHVRKKINGDNAYFVLNRHVNPTNICVNRCSFCAFSRSKGKKGAYELTLPQIIKNIREARPLRELHIVGGLHPDWGLEDYLSLISGIRKAFPRLHIKAFTAVEVDYMQRQSGLQLPEVLRKLKAVGVGSMPGGGAEIFDEGVREKLCPEKISGTRWIEVMEAAHGVGIKSNATMLYGHMETLGHRVEHLLRLRELQDRTGGFQAFIPLSYHPQNTEAGGRGASGLDDLRTMAVSRLVLDNFPHIKAYWVMLGQKLSQLALLFGADDLDGTVVQEKITRAAGGGTGGGITRQELVRLIKAAGRSPVERDSFYRTVKQW